MGLRHDEICLKSLFDFNITIFPAREFIYFIKKLYHILTI